MAATGKINPTAPGLLIKVRKLTIVDYNVPEFYNYSINDIFTYHDMSGHIFVESNRVIVIGLVFFELIRNDLLNNLPVPALLIS